MKLMSLPILDGGDVNFLLFFSFFQKKISGMVVALNICIWSKLIFMFQLFNVSIVVALG